MNDIAVPFLDLSREFNDYGDELLNQARQVLERGMFIQGDEVASFEDEFSTYVGSEHGVGVNSGSDALYLTLRAIGIEGKEVVLPSHTFVSTADAVVRNGGTPVFVDVNPDRYTLDPDAVKEHVDEGTAAIIPVHLYGQPTEMDPIFEVAEEYDATVVEDASQAHGAYYRDDPVGSLGDVACFSLYPTKNLGAYGDAGIVVTSDDDLAERIRMAREYGSPERYQYDFVGTNSRLDELQAAMLRYKLSQLDELNRRRREIADSYNSSLEGVSTPFVADDVEHVYHLYVVETKERDELQAHLDEHGIDTLIHYPTPIHQQPSYEDIGIRGDLEVTERVTDRILSLPMHPWCRPEEVNHVVETIRRF